MASADTVRRRRFELLRSRAGFRALFAGQTVSQVGSQVSLLALPYTALTAVDASPSTVAVLAAVQFSPFVVLVLPAGVFVDRLRRRPLLIIADVVRSVALISIAASWALDVLTIWQLAVVSFAVGACTALFDVSYQAFVPDLVERDELEEANSSLQVSESGASLAGPALGGAVLGWVAGPVALLIDAGSFVFSALAVARIDVNEQVAPAPSRDRIWPELSAGLRYVLGHPYLRASCISAGLLNLAYSLAVGLQVTFALRTLDVSTTELGFAFAIGGAGWLLAALVASSLRVRMGVGRLTLFATVLGALGALLLPVASGPLGLVIFAAGVASTSASAALFNIQQVSARQSLTPPAMRGRMTATIRFVAFGTMPIGALLGAALTPHLGIRGALFVGAAIAATATIPVVVSPIASLKGYPQPEPAG